MKDSAEIDRRAFIRVTSTAAGAALTSCLLSSCGNQRTRMHPTSSPRTPATAGLPTKTATPSAAPASPSATIPAPSPSPSGPAEWQGRVALVRSEDRAEAVAQALELLEINPVRGKAILLKPNLNSADPFPGSTHVDTLLELIKALRGMGAGEITIGDRSGMGDTRAVMRAKHIPAMAEDLGLSTLVFDELGPEEWEIIQPAEAHWRSGFAIPRAALHAEGIVQTCCLKTHRFGGHFTLSLKNSVGLAAKRIPGQNHDYMTELHNSPHQRRMIAEINSAYAPDLILLDGMAAFVDGGPDRGTKVEPGVVLAGTDRVAIDAVGVAILRHYGTTPAVEQGPIFAQEQIARAAELGLGVSRAQGIELLTADLRSAEFARQIEEILARG